MKTRRFFHNWNLCISLILFSIAHLPLSIHAESPPSSHLIENYAKTPLTFEQNQGQTDEQVEFLSRGQGYALFLTQNEAVLSLNRPDANTTDIVRLQLIGANPNPIIKGLETQTSRSNYLIGNDPEKWHTNVRQTGKVKYLQVYDGIDLIYYGNQRRLEYDYIVEPGVSPSKIQMSFTGVNQVHIDDAGNLVLYTENGKVVQQAPITYQVFNNQRKKVSSSYTICQTKPKWVVGFKIGEYDTTQTLIIDPILNYSTFLGGTQSDVTKNGNAIAVDTNQNLYITGHTQSIDFPMQASHQSVHAGQTDIFVSKLNASGTALIYSTFLGGSLGDEGNAIAVDNDGSVYLIGTTTSSDFPTHNPFQASYQGDNSDAVLVKIDSTGSNLEFSTYVGGSGTDRGNSITINQTGEVFITGETASSDFPVMQAFQSTYTSSFDAFVSKFDNSGSSLSYSTYLGGDGHYDSGSDIAIDNSGHIYVTGITTGSNFPTKNAYQPTYGGGSNDIFVTKIDPSDTTLVFSTYLGGSNSDRGSGIALNSSDNIFVIGGTQSTDFPTQNAFQTSNGGDFDTFITKFNTSGTSLDFSTYLGGNFADESYAVALDSLDNIYLAGYSKSSNFPTTHALQPSHGGNTDAFIAKLDPTNATLNFSSFLGGVQSDEGHGIALDGFGNIYVAGITSSSDFPSKQAYQTSSKGSTDLFITKISPIFLSSSALDFENVAVDSQSQKTLTVTNNSLVTLTVSGITISGTDAGLFSVSPSSFSLTPNQTQEIIVTFLPTSTGTKSATLSIADNISSNPITVSLNGQGVAPTISLSATTLSFENAPVGGNYQQTISISNIGNDTLKITNSLLTGTDANIFSISPTAFNVLPGQSQNVTITFAPTSSGNKTASLSITHNASNSPTTLLLNGHGGIPAITLSTTTINLANISVGNSSNQTLTISNTGDDTLTVSGITISGTDASIFSVSPTSLTVLPSQNQDITVTAIPTTYGDISATLSIAHNASGSPTSVSLTATGEAPDISLSANSLNFGDVEVNAEKTLTLVVTNTGNADLIVSNITSTNATFTISPTTFTIGANNNQGVGVTFKPTATGNQSATVTITSNDPDSNTITMTLTGTGTQNTPQPPPPTPVINFPSPTISFGSVSSGTQHSQDFTISNTGQATLTISDISLTGDAYSISSTLADIAPGQSGSLTITFAPTTSGEATGTLTVTHNASGSPNVISLTGTGVIEPGINVAQTSLDFGQVLANTTGSTTLTITNTGNADLQIANFAFTNPRFVTNDSSLTIAGGDSQQVAINFLPVTGGLNTGTLTITHNASSDPIQISLRGEGTLPLGLQITPSSIDFARVDINGQSNQTLTLENPGTDTLNIVTLQTYRLDFQVVQGDSIPITLAPSESRVLDLLFLPRRSGITTGDLTLSTADSTFTISLQGEGVVAQPALTPQLEITPQEITFSTLSNTVSDTAIITVSNTQGTGTLFVTDIQSTDSLITVNADSFIIKPGEQRQIQVVAQAAERDFPTGQITFESNDPNTPTASLVWRAGALLEDFVLLDLDNQTGDQNMQRLTGVLSGDSITVQFFSKNFPTITGYGMFVDYNTSHMTFVDHTFNTSFITGATEQIRDNNGRVNFGVTSFSGVEASGNEFLGALTFQLTESFADSTALTFNTITLSLANDSLQELPQRTSVWLVEGNSPDFSGDGQIDFRDFLLFGQAFGGSDPNFDLDGDGSVGFPDFILFAAAFGG